MKRFTPILAAVALALPIAGSVAQAQHQSAATMKLTATLTGKGEAPAKGDPKGSGTASITLNAATGKVCYNLKVKGITLPALAAHIHIGKAGKAGGVVVVLGTPGKTGFALGCTSKVKATLIAQIEKHPSSYYVNVHTLNYSNGAVRGQLH